MQTTVCHTHNLNRDLSSERRYGIRVTLPSTDTFSRLLGPLERYHWYATPRERDAALRDMAAEHLYSRRGDRPTLHFEAVDQASPA
jgi:hypothetical protein